MWLNSLLVEQSPSQLDGTKLREIFCLGYKFASLCACFLVTQYLKTESIYLKIQISDSFWKKMEGLLICVCPHVGYLWAGEVGVLGETHTPQFATVLRGSVTSTVAGMTAHWLLTEDSTR